METTSLSIALPSPPTAGGTAWSGYSGIQCYSGSCESFATVGSWTYSTAASHGYYELNDLAVDEAGAGYAAITYESDWYGHRPVSFGVYRCPLGTQECTHTYGPYSDSYGADRLSPSLAAGAADSFHAVWADARYRNSDIYYWTGAWGDEMVNDDVCSSPRQAKPDLAIDAAGNAYAVWEDIRQGDAGIYFAYRPASGGWQTPIRLQEAGVQADRFSPAIAVDPAGNAYAVWTDMRNREGDIYFAYRPAGGSWSPVSVYPSAGKILWDQSPDIAVDAGGTAYVVWDGLERPYADDFLFFSQRARSGGWSQVEELVTSAEGNVRPVIAAGEAGNLMVLAYWSGQLRSMARPAGGSWAASERSLRQLLTSSATSTWHWIVSATAYALFTDSRQLSELRQPDFCSPIGRRTARGSCRAFAGNP